MESKAKIVLDTNIWVSALLFTGSARDFILQLVLPGKEIVISDYIIQEIEQVTSRDKFDNKQVFVKIWRLLRQEIEVIKLDISREKIVVRNHKDHPHFINGSTIRRPDNYNRR